MNSIFISYRRDDAEGQAGRLYDDLAAAFGKDSVFMDVAAINPGLDFRKAVDKGLSSCSVFLAVIGKSWLNSADSSGKRRLDDPADFVRLEIAEALKRVNIPVVPVLVQGALIPSVDDLPDDLKDLVYRNAVEISHARWSSDMTSLITALRTHVNKSQPSDIRSPSSNRKWLTLGLIVMALAIFGFYVLYRFLPSSLNSPNHEVNPPVTSQVAHSPDLSGVWLQTNPRTNVEKPDPPMRLRITQHASDIAVEISYTGVFSGVPIGKTKIENGKAEWTVKGGCGSSTFLVYLRGRVLIYEVTDTFPVPCGGHPAGVEHRPVAELQRLSN